MNDLLITFYGDDFTGSTDALEALTRAGVRTVLFLKRPRDAFSHFPHARAIGLAGTSRTLTPGEMDEVLPDLFRWLRGHGAPVVHYKTCSTFDSSPEIGSIGRALDLGHDVFRAAYVPLLVGAPRLGRHCIFGNLFARSGPESDVFRLDRHPSMSRHPVTPMDESDLRLHIARQTDKQVMLFDVLQYERDDESLASGLEELLQKQPDIVLFDALYDEHLKAAGGLIWRGGSSESPLFVVGSSGVEYALAAHWGASGIVDEPAPLPSPEPASRMIVVSGSCSPVTGAQIAHAVRAGFAEVPLATAQLADPDRSDAAREAAETQALDALRSGQSVILHTCSGPDDPRLAETRRRFAEPVPGADRLRSRTGLMLGRQLGRALRRLLRETGVRRAVVAGGDTSGHVAAELDIEALEMAAPLAPGTPLCRAHAPGTDLHGLEIAFKGGQVGKVNFFGTVLHGSADFDESPRVAM